MLGSDVDIILTTRVQQLNGNELCARVHACCYGCESELAAPLFPFPPQHTVTRMRISSGWESFEVLWAVIYLYCLSSCPWTWCYRKSGSCPTEAIVPSKIAVCCCQSCVYFCFLHILFLNPVTSLAMFSHSIQFTGSFHPPVQCGVKSLLFERCIWN